jgi:uncharacterized membrane protein YgaE (UPF0421/DUF939 family)
MTSAQKTTCNLSSHSFPQNPKKTCQLLALFWIVISERRNQTASEIRAQGEPGKKKSRRKNRKKTETRNEARKYGKRKPITTHESIKLKRRYNRSKATTAYLKKHEHAGDDKNNKNPPKKHSRVLQTVEASL